MSLADAMVLAATATKLPGAVIEPAALDCTRTVKTAVERVINIIVPSSLAKLEWLLGKEAVSGLLRDMEYVSFTQSFIDGRNL